MDDPEQEIVSTQMSAGRDSKTLGVMLVVGLPVLIGAVLLCRGLFMPLALDSELIVDQRDIDYGEIWTSASFVHRLRISNSSQRSIQIDGFRMSCTCVQIDPPSLVIAPRTTQEVAVTIDQTRRPKDDRSTSHRAFSVNVTPLSKDLKDSAPTWILRGIAKDAILTEPVALDLGVVVPGQPLPSREVRVTAVTPIQHLTATAEKPFTARLEPTKEGYSLAVSVESAEEPGNLKKAVWLEASDHDGVLLPRIPVRLSAMVLSDMRATPSAILAGMQPLGSSYEAMIQVGSRTGQPFELTITKQAAGVELQELDGSLKRQIRTIRLRCSPQKSGDQTIVAKLIVTNLNSGKQSVLAVPVYCYGTNPTSHN